MIDKGEFGYSLSSKAVSVDLDLYVNDGVSLNSMEFEKGIRVGLYNAGQAAQRNALGKAVTCGRTDESSGIVGRVGGLINDCLWTPGGGDPRYDSMDRRVG